MLMPARMMILASLSLVCAASAAAADPSLGHWLTGNGLIAGQPATNGATFIAGQNIVSSPTAPALIDLALPASGVITLAPGSDVSLSTRPAKDGGHGELVLTINKGAAQVNLLNKGPYQDMLVYSAGMVVRVKGSLLVVQHSKTDKAYAAAVAAKMDVAAADANGNAAGSFTEVADHQGTGNSDGTISPPITLLSRPQVNTTTDIQTQGSTPDPHADPPKAAGSENTAKGYVSVTPSSWNHDAGTGQTLAQLATSDPAAAVKALATISVDTAHPEMAAAAAADLTNTIVSNNPAMGIAVTAALASANPAVAAQAMQGALQGLQNAAANGVSTQGIGGAMVASVMINAQPDSVKNDPNNPTIKLMVAAAVATDPASAAAVVAAAIAACPGQAAGITAAAIAQAQISGGPGAAALVAAIQASADAQVAANNQVAGGNGALAGTSNEAGEGGALSSFDSLVTSFVNSIPPTSQGTSPGTINGNGLGPSGKPITPE
jgi:hypothetical protein